MNVLIAYRSKYGATETCAHALAERIKAETALADLRIRHAPDVHAFDVVLIGGSIYGGSGASCACMLSVWVRTPRACESFVRSTALDSRLG